MSLLLENFSFANFGDSALKNSEKRETLSARVHFQTISLDYQEALAAVLGGGDAAESNF